MPVCIFAFLKLKKLSSKKTAQSYNINVPHMIRRLVLAVHGEAQLVEPELSEIIRDLCRQLHAIGVNINQLTPYGQSRISAGRAGVFSILEQIHACCLAVVETHGEMIIYTRGKVYGAVPRSFTLT